MLDRFVEQKEAIMLYQTTETGKKFTFNSTDFQLASDVKKLLQPAYEATVELSGENYVTGSKVIPITKALLLWYSEAAQSQRESNYQLASALSMSLYKYLGHYEEMEALSLSTLCDPRYKREGFRSAESLTLASNTLKDKMQTGLSAIQRSSPQPQAPDSATPSGGLWSFLDREVGMKRSNTASRGAEDAVMTEIVKYMKLINLPCTTNPLKWWQENGKEQFPRVYQVAISVLPAPGTSVPSERVFSSAGTVISKLRSSLSDSTAGNLIFLKENLSKK